MPYGPKVNFKHYFIPDHDLRRWVSTGEVARGAVAGVHTEVGGLAPGEGANGEEGEAIIVVEDEVRYFCSFKRRNECWLLSDILYNFNTSENCLKCHI